MFFPSMFKAGDILEGRYQVLEELSSGGFGEVYRVQDPRSRAVYALKVFRGAIDEELSEYLRYSRKLQKSLATLGSRNFIYPIETGKIAGLDYQLLPYVEGKSLENIIDDGAPLHPKKALEIAAKAADALRELHAHNIIHGDIKPGNIMLNSTETDVFLIDFGMVQPAKGNSTLIFGTLRYMHPSLRGYSERLPSETAPHVTSSIHGRYGEYIDIYALGVTVFEMLAGEAEIQFPLSERQLVKLLQDNNPFLRTLEPQVLDQLANMIFQMLTIRPEKKGITARIISSICMTIVKHFWEKNGVELKLIRPTSAGSQEHVPENLMDADQGLGEAVLRLRSIAESLNESTAIMIRTAGKLEMAATKESDSPILGELNKAFRNALGRTRTSWKVTMMMTIVCFLTIIAMIFSAVLLTIITGTASWSMIFGGLGVAAVIGTLIWRPYDKAFRATILAQQLEMIQVQTLAAFRGTADIKYRIRICREAIDRLQILLEQHAIIETRENSV